MGIVENTLKLNDQMSNTLASVSSLLINTQTAMQGVKNENLGGEFLVVKKNAGVAEKSIESLTTGISGSTTKLSNNITNVLKPVNTLTSDVKTAMSKVKDVDIGKGFLDAKNNIEGTEKAVKNLTKGVNEFSDNAVKATRSAGDGFTVLKGIAVNVIQEIASKGTEMSKSFLKFGDDMINVKSRLNLMNDTLQTTDELNRKIFDSAQRSVASYETTAKAVTQLGLSASNAFKSNDEIIAFTELLNKSFVIAGTAGQQAESVMFNLTQAMGAGVLRGQDLNSILANTPQIARGIEKYLGAADGSIKKLAEDGVITSDIVKNAMFAMSNDINTEFESMQNTFADTSVVLKDKFKFAFSEMSISFNKFASEAITNGSQLIVDNIDQIANTAIVAGSVLAVVAGGMAVSWAVANYPVTLTIGAILLVGKTLTDLGYTTEDILTGIGTAWGAVYSVVYNSVMGLSNAVVWVANKALEIKDKFTGEMNEQISYKGYLDIETEMKKSGGKFGQAGSQLTEGINALKDLFANNGQNNDSLGDLISSNFGDLVANTSGGKALKTSETSKIKIDQEDLKFYLDVATQRYQINYKEVNPSVIIQNMNVSEKADSYEVMQEIADKVTQMKETDLEGG